MTTFNRNLTKRKKGSCFMKFVVLVLVAVAVYFGIKFANEGLDKFIEPRERIVYSQEEALQKLQSLLPSWSGDHSQLPAMFKNREETFSWLKTQEARDSASWIMAMELDRYGYRQESQPFIVETQLRNIRNIDSYPPEQADQILNAAEDWAMRLEGREAKVEAELLYDAIVSLGVDKAKHYFIQALEHSINIKIERSDVSVAIPLLENYHQEAVLNELKTPEEIRTAAGFLLMEDSIKSSLSKGDVTVGREIARKILEKNNLQISPEMGRIYMIEINADLRKDEITSERAAEMSKQLQTALNCFKGAEPKSLSYVPEIMLALAKLHYSTGNPALALTWVDRADGVVMALGVTNPRFFPGNSLSQDISALRRSCSTLLEEMKITASLRENIKLADKFIEEQNYDQAVRVAESNLADATKQTAYVNGYIPFIHYQLIRALRADKKWMRAGNELESLIGKMSALSPQELERMQTAIGFFNLPKDFYKKVHRELASIYMRSKQYTRAKEVMKNIDEDISSIAPAE